MVSVSMDHFHDNLVVGQDRRGTRGRAFESVLRPWRMTTRIHEDWVSSKFSVSYIAVRLFLVYPHGSQTFFRHFLTALYVDLSLSLISCK